MESINDINIIKVILFSTSKKNIVIFRGELERVDTEFLQPLDCSVVHKIIDHRETRKDGTQCFTVRTLKTKGYSLRLKRFITREFLPQIDSDSDSESDEDSDDFQDAHEF